MSVRDDWDDIETTDGSLGLGNSLQALLKPVSSIIKFLIETISIDHVMRLPLNQWSN